MGYKFYFTQTDHEDQMWGSEGCNWALQMRQQILSLPNSPYAMVDSPEEADIIVYWEPHQSSQVILAPRLRAHPLIHEFPNKAFIVAIEDRPLGFLPGLYVSLPKQYFHPDRHRTWIYYRTQNPYIFEAEYTRPVDAPENLAHFAGANSHAIRARLFSLAETFARDAIVIEETERARFAADPHDRNHRSAQLGFINGLLHAKFGLCPRGNGAGTYRLQEVLALGRAPVIISDDWTPVDGLDWDQFAVFVPERELEHLPELLRAQQDRWATMGRRAKQVYWEHFRREIYAAGALEHIVAIYQQRRHDERDFIAQWDRMVATAPPPSKSF